MPKRWEELEKNLGLERQARVSRRAEQEVAALLEPLQGQGAETEMCRNDFDEETE